MQLSRVNLLLVDADEQGRHVLEISLRQAGFFVECAAGNQQAWERLDLAPPDLLIIDTSHPGTDGFGLCQRVREAAAWQDLPLLMIGSDLSAETRVHALQLGVDDYLTKPIFVKDIVARVRMALDRRQREYLAQGDHSGSFTGDLSEMPLVDVIQVMEIGRKSGVVRLHAPPDQLGTLFFRDGKLVDAELGTLEGAAAVYRLLTWTTGTFESELKAVRRKDMLGLANHAALAEGLRRADQWSKLLEQLPALETVFDVDFQQLGERLGDIPDEVNAVLRLFDGERSLLRVLDECDYDDIEALTIIGRLYFDGLIHETAGPAKGSPPADAWGESPPTVRFTPLPADVASRPVAAAEATTDGGEAFARAVAAEATAGSVDAPVGAALDADGRAAVPAAEEAAPLRPTTAFGAEIEAAARGLQAIATAPGAGAPLRPAERTPLPAGPPRPAPAPTAAPPSTGSSDDAHTPPFGSRITPPVPPATVRARRTTAERGSGTPTSPGVPRVNAAPGGGAPASRAKTGARPASDDAGSRVQRRITASGWAVGNAHASGESSGSRPSVAASPQSQPSGLTPAPPSTTALPAAALGSAAPARPSDLAAAPRESFAPADTSLDSRDEVFFAQQTPESTPQPDFRPDFRRTRSSVEFFVGRQQRLARWKWGALAAGSLGIGAGLAVLWSQRTPPTPPRPTAAAHAPLAQPATPAPLAHADHAAPARDAASARVADSQMAEGAADLPTDGGAAPGPIPPQAAAASAETTPSPTARPSPAGAEYGALVAQARKLGHAQRARALRLWQQAVALDPAGWEALEQLALEALNRGRYDDALALAQRAESAHAESAAAQLVIGAVLQDRGDRRAARAAYEKYLRLCPRCEHARDIAAVLRNL